MGVSPRRYTETGLLLTIFAFNFNLRRYSEEQIAAAAAAAADAAVVGWCRLTLSNPR
jgi:hypothetical protein